MCNNVRLMLLKVLVSLLVSVAVFSTLVLRYFTGLPSIRDSELLNFTQMAYIFLPISLVFLLIKDVVPGSTCCREYMVLVSLILISMYSLIGSLGDIVRLEPGRYVYIPPMFIVIEYSLETTYITFRSLTISIPLCTTFVIFIYGLQEAVKTYRALKIKELSKTIDRSDVQEVHDVEGQGCNP